MSSISNVQQFSHRYNFSIEVPCQAMGKIVMIEQCNNQGLKVFVKDVNSHILHPVEKHMISGLPKINFVPPEFFEQCYSIVKNCRNEVQQTCYGIDFRIRLLGGSSRGGRPLPKPPGGKGPKGNGGNKNGSVTQGSVSNATKSRGSVTEGSVSNATKTTKGKKTVAQGSASNTSRQPNSNNAGKYSSEPVVNAFLASAKEARNTARFDAGIPLGAKPIRVIPPDSKGNKAWVYKTHTTYNDRAGNITNLVAIQHHPNGHSNEPRPHWHVRPVSSEGEVDANGHNPANKLSRFNGLRRHYFYPGKG